MTEKSASDVLREMLDERGIEWRSGLEGVTLVGDWCFVEYDNGRLAATCEPALTPEQAIAATLGEEKAGKKSPPKGGPGPCGQPSDDIIHDAATLGGNPSAVIERLRQTVRDAFCGESVSMLVEGHAIMRAIDDVEAATLGGGECENTAQYPLSSFECSVCGCTVEGGDELGADIQHGAWNYCPNCRAKVRKAMEQ